MAKSTQGREQGQEDTQRSLRFVNYSNLDTQKSTASKGAIRSHLTRLAHRKVRRDRMIQFQQSKRTGTTWEQHPEQGLPMIHGHEITNGSTIKSPNTQAPRTSGMVQPQLGLMNLLNGGGKDPFQSSAVQLTGSEQYLMDHCEWLFDPAIRLLVQWSPFLSTKTC